jgi:AcrR family transcriptional regulator
MGTTVRPHLKPRKSPSQGRARETVEAILEATARILVKHGYAGTNTNLIAELAGISVGSLYQYFPNKESLIAALNVRHAERIHSRIAARLIELEGKSLREAIPALVREVVAVHLENPELERMLETELSYLDAPLGDDEADRNIIEMSRRFLESHKREIRRRDLGLANIVILKMLESLVHALLFQYPGRASNQQRERAVSEAVLGYLTYRDTR